MNDDRAPLGLLIAAVGAAALAISVFEPWYGLSLTASGATAAQQQLAAFAQQYGNAALQAKVDAVGARYNALVGHRLLTVSAHQAFGHISLILLVLAGIALLSALLRLADARGLFYASGKLISLLGALAAGAVIFRIAVKPDGVPAFIPLSLSWGIWLALLSAGAILAGGVIAGDGRSRLRATQMRGPGPPPIGREVASPLAIFRDQKR
jgi:hypothetical protein